MNRIAITEHYFFTATKKQYMLYHCGEREKVDIKTRTSTGEMKQFAVVIGYYETLAELLKGCKKHMLRNMIANGEVETLDEVINAINDIQERENTLLEKVKDF